MELVQIGSKRDNDSLKKSSKSKIDLTTNHVSEIKIWLVDPTYTQQQISSESMPSAVGGIATFSEANLKLKYPIRLFKYPVGGGTIFKKDLWKEIGGFDEKLKFQDDYDFWLIINKLILPIW